MRGLEERDPGKGSGTVRSRPLAVCVHSPSVRGWEPVAVRGEAPAGRSWTLGIFGVLALLLATATVLSVPSPAAAQAYDELEARIWVSGGTSPVFHRGDRVGVYYRATADAYVAVFHVDTDGIVRLLHPRVPDEDHYVRRDRTYRLRFARSSRWYVDDYPGVGYFFIVSSYTPLDFSSFRYSHVGGGWDLGNVGRRVYQDPYLAMDDFVAALVPDWRTGGYALDFVEYNVDRRFDYPRFLCYDCHAFRTYRSWDPYRYQCHSFRLIIHTDPYFYPVNRYRGTRVVYTRPPVRNQPRFAFKERARGEPATPIFQRSSETDLPGVAGAERRRSTAGQGGEPLDRTAVPRAPTPGRGDAPSTARDGRDPSGGGRPDARPDARRVPDRPGRVDPPGSVREPTPSRGGRRGGAVSPRSPTDRLRERTGDRPSTSDRDPPRPVLERRPPSRSPDRAPDRTPDRGSPSRPGARPSSPDAGSSSPGARPSSPQARPSNPRGRSDSPSPDARPRAREPRQGTPDRSPPSSRSPSPNRSPSSTRSPSSGGSSRSPSARPRSGDAASPAPRSGGSGTRGTPQRRGRGRPPR